jgi:hypothetical protein
MKKDLRIICATICLVYLAILSAPLVSGSEMKHRSLSGSMRTTSEDMSEDDDAQKTWEKNRERAKKIKGKDHKKKKTVIKTQTGAIISPKPPVKPTVPAPKPAVSNTPAVSTPVTKSTTVSY